MFESGGSASHYARCEPLATIVGNHSFCIRRTATLPWDVNLSSIFLVRGIPIDAAADDVIHRRSLFRVGTIPTSLCSDLSVSTQSF